MQRATPLVWHVLAARPTLYQAARVRVHAEHACRADTQARVALRSVISARRASSPPALATRIAIRARQATFVSRAHPHRSRAQAACTPTRRCSTSQATSARLTSASCALLARAAQWARRSQRFACLARTRIPKRRSRARSAVRASFRMASAPPLARHAERALLANTSQLRAVQ